MSPLQEVVSSVSGSYSRSVLWRSSEALIVGLQAVSRGFLIRQKLEARRRYLVSQTPAVIIIQVRAVWSQTGGFIRSSLHLTCLTLTCLCSVSLEKVCSAEGVQTSAAASLHELESRCQGNSQFTMTTDRHLVYVCLNN